MVITVNIEDEEYSVKFIVQPHPTQSGRKWKGNILGSENESLIQFIEINGEPKNIKVSQKITTSPVTLEERIKIALESEREIESDGFENTETEESEKKLDGIVSDPYDPDDIKVRRDVFTVTDIYNKIRRGDIDLNPEFQRHLVWDEKQKSRLIESVLLGIPLPVFYFSQDHDGIYHVVDGLQRLSTIRDFFDNVFYLRNLEHLSLHCDKRYYQAGDKNIRDNQGTLVSKGKINGVHSLDRRFQRRFEDTQLNVNVIEASSPASVKYDIFKRINKSGRHLNQQEIRNCLAKPHTRRFMQELANLPEFLSATGKSVSDQRMAAQEMVLRFAGFYLSQRSQLTYKGDMNDFLDKTLDIINKMNEEDLQPIRKNFTNAMENSYHLFGQYCFRKYLPNQLGKGKQLINKSLYVTWSAVLSNYSIENLKKYIDFESFALTLALKFEGDTEYWRIVTTGTSDKRNLEIAFSKTEQLANQHLSL